ncbi:MAG: hypothetical protein M1358_13770 [Chloroflexi bacterium]|nr:hypothetical protein [Chloroflexota bacterium]
MEPATYDIRLATEKDVDKIKSNIRHSMTSPDGKGARKGLTDAVARRELLVLERLDPRDFIRKVEAFIEWRMRVDGTITIRDIGTSGEEPHEGMAKRLIRELLRLTSPSEARVKLRADQAVWNAIFQDLPGFFLEGQEYSRPYWRNLWLWTPEAEKRDRAPRERPRPARGR